MKVKMKKELEDAFKTVPTVTVKAYDVSVQAISINELPVTYMLSFMQMSEGERMPKMLEYFKLCLTNPADWDRIETQLTTSEVMRMIDQWMAFSMSNIGESNDGDAKPKRRPKRKREQNDSSESSSD